MPANTGIAGAIHRVIFFAGMPAPTALCGTLTISITNSMSSAFTFKRQADSIRLPPGNLHGPQPMLQQLPGFFVLNTLKRPPDIAVGEHQVVGNIHQRELHRDDAFADRAGKGFALGKIKDVGRIGDQFFHELTIPG